MVDKKHILLYSLLFCYTFAFFIAGISVSILLGGPLWLYAFLNKKFLNQILQLLNYTYIKRVVKIWYLLVLLSLFFPLIYGTYDFSFFRLIGAQGIHYFSAFPVLAWLKYNKFSFEEVENAFIVIFIIQTIIQLIVVNNDFLGEKILAFNHFEPEKVLGPGSKIRGKALSAATTYHLTMAYGIAFIIYIKSYLSKKVNIKNLLIGLSLFVGIFFAGRTGFVACLIGVLGYLLNSKPTIKSKLIFVTKSIFLVTCLIFIFLIGISITFPSFYDMLNKQIFPYAFEFIYSIEESGGVETQSTNRLMEMWETNFNYIEFIFGSGKYTNPDGSYYMHIDPGIIRHTLFMGIIGYAILILYQLNLLPIWKFKGETKYYYCLILLFLCIMEFKCINLGVNKFAFSISLLLSFSYLHLPHTKIFYEKNNVGLRDSSRSNKNGSSSQGVTERY